MSRLDLRHVDAAAAALRESVLAWRGAGAEIDFPAASPQADARYIAFHATAPSSPWNPPNLSNPSHAASSPQGWCGMVRCDEWLAGVAPALAGLAWSTDSGDDKGAVHARQLFAATPRPLSTAFPYRDMTVTGLVSGADFQGMPLAALRAPEATVWLRDLPALPWQQRMQQETQPHPAAIAAWTRDIAVPLQFMLGHSQLSSGGLSRAAPGDVLLVTEYAPRIHCNGLVLGWYSINDEGMSVDELLNEPYEKTEAAGLQEAAAGSAAELMAELAAEPADSGQYGASVAPVAAGVSRIPVRLEFVLQQNRMTIGEIGCLRAGQIVGLKPDAEKNVLVLANGAVVGRGELVQLEERLGVELFEIYGSDDHAD